MQSYPYRLLGSSVKAKTISALRELLDAWAKEWFVSPPDYEIRMTEAISPGTDWQLSGNDADRWIACVPKEQALRDFMLLLFGAASGGTSSGVAADVMQACMDDLLQRLLPGHAAPATIAPMALRTGEGSGAVYVEIEGVFPVKAVVLGGAWVEAASLEALPASDVVPKLSASRSLLGSSKVRVELGLGEAELPLSELAGIAVGDVLALDVSYRTPLQLKTEDGLDLCKVHLGRVDQHMAIQVTGT